MPASLVTAVSAPIWAGLVAVTVTPGSTPPCASLISPLMLPVELAPPPCANAGAARATSAASAKRILLQPFMCEPPGGNSQQRRCPAQLGRNEVRSTVPRHATRGWSHRRDVRHTPEKVP